MNPTDHIDDLLTALEPETLEDLDVPTADDVQGGGRSTSAPPCTSWAM